jgi:hypothetical protein
MRKRRKWHGFFNEGFCFIGFGVKGPSKFGFIVNFWFRALSFKEWGF